MKNKSCQVEFEQGVEASIGNEGIAFLRVLMEKDPSRRVSAAQALGHAFFSS